MNKQRLLDDCQAVLLDNNRGSHTIPAQGLYPHQWLWDSCFIAIGLRHFDIDAAKREIFSLLKGQWTNGMIPHMIFAPSDAYQQDRNIWRSWLNPNAPDHLSTSGITQPPMVAEAVVRIGRKLPTAERHSWYKQVYPALARYHLWLATERIPTGDGLCVLLHPYECGLDNTPAWVHYIRSQHMPWWTTTIERLHIDWLVNLFRRDTKHTPPGQRISNTDALLNYVWVRRLRRCHFDTPTALKRKGLALQDIAFNSIFIRANQHLADIAADIQQELPQELAAYNDHAAAALDSLWDEYATRYYARDFHTQQAIKQPSIQTLMPLYSRSITPQRAEQLVRLIEDEQLFGSPYPVPSVPLNSPCYKPHSYWQGPTWVNTNWLIIDGLRHYGFHDHAALLRDITIELVERSGAYEYFSPQDGTPAGAHNFSWTAALTIDLLQH
ncbi:glycoside hydrolase [Candidatus Saccharibacteria bacterium]|nr:MAG: glycoside hydrolase [Candidatus Saccharibacteria bacterium]